ncbi:hypothetical protein CC85DRAFT_304499 [Cutaneotrichosporon oleaginosum]|uniref:HMA domain-containing protein n=1 Tax=Cutaneotrichosporon oleaginosum TaxID=879819 RepID=A0A0J1AXG2_9TREE|nr:uncharacterized protein CC85DRAFT_304499 [Cutaneotrichosporon oleaginosum]KLT40004.1 hypothetical protein CC85DRAFT_304499 [Cutaneotrichosporon oleaginosum]
MAVSPSPPPLTQSTGPAYNYTVKMTCGGCSGAIERVLKKNIEARECEGG